MTDPPPLLLDEHIPDALLQAIHDCNAIRLADPILAFRVGDRSGATPPAGILDPDLLIWAEVHGWVILSMDRNTLIKHHGDHLAAGRHSYGLFILRKSFAIADVVASLALAFYAARPDEWRDRVVFLPF